MITIHGRVEGGVFSNVRHLMETLRQFEGNSITLSVRKRQTKWTDQQRKYLFGAVYPFLSDITGLSIEQVREGMKRLLLSRTNGKLQWTLSESDLTMDLYEWYLTQMDQWCIENYGLNIPGPEER